MKISKKSWHYRFLTNWCHIGEQYIPENLCPYLLAIIGMSIIILIAVVLICCFTIPLYLLLSIIGTLFGYQLYSEARNYWNPFYIYYYGIPVGPGDVTSMFDALFTDEQRSLFSIGHYEIYLWHIILSALAIWFTIVYPIITLWIICIGIVSVVLFYLLLRTKMYSFIRDFLKVKKAKICPRIEFVD